MPSERNPVSAPSKIWIWLSAVSVIVCGVIAIPAGIFTIQSIFERGSDALDELFSPLGLLVLVWPLQLIALWRFYALRSSKPYFAQEKALLYIITLGGLILGCAWAGVILGFLYGDLSLGLAMAI